MATIKRGFVKFDRKIKEWGWYTDVKTFKLFFHLILCANFTDGFFLGVPIKRGQLAKSVEHLAVETGLTCAEVRTAIKHLESTGEITSKGHPKFTVFSIVNYDLYQSEQRAFNEHLANSLTSNQRTDNEQLTSNQRQYKNDKNKNNDKNERMKEDSFNRSSEKKLRFLQGELGKGVVMLSEEQEIELLNMLSLEEFNKYVSIVRDCELNGKKFKKPHYQAILDMVKKDRGI